MASSQRKPKSVHRHNVKTHVSNNRQRVRGEHHNRTIATQPLITHEELQFILDLYD